MLTDGEGMPEDNGDLCLCSSRVASLASQPFTGEVGKRDGKLRHTHRKPPLGLKRSHRYQQEIGQDWDFSEC